MLPTKARAEWPLLERVVDSRLGFEVVFNCQLCTAENLGEEHLLRGELDNWGKTDIFSIFANDLVHNLITFEEITVFSMMDGGGLCKKIHTQPHIQ